jgi:hypothetical protein
MKQIIQDQDGRYSSKRVSAFLMLFYVMLLYIWKDVPFEDLLLFLGFVGTCFGISGLEKFSKYASTNNSSVTK